MHDYFLVSRNWFDLQAQLEKQSETEKNDTYAIHIADYLALLEELENLVVNVCFVDELADVTVWVS